MRVKGFIASLLLMACAQTGMAQRVILHLVKLGFMYSLCIDRIILKSKN